MAQSAFASSALADYHRTPKSRFTYKHLSQLISYIPSTPLRTVAHIDLDDILGFEFHNRRMYVGEQVRQGRRRAGKTGLDDLRLAGQSSAVFRECGRIIPNSGPPLA